METHQAAHIVDWDIIAENRHIRKWPRHWKHKRNQTFAGKREQCDMIRQEEQLLTKQERFEENDDIWDVQTREEESNIEIQRWERPCAMSNSERKIYRALPSQRDSRGRC